MLKRYILTICETLDNDTRYEHMKAETGMTTWQLVKLKVVADEIIDCIQNYMV